MVLRRSGRLQNQIARLPPPNSPHSLISGGDFDFVSDDEGVVEQPPPAADEDFDDTILGQDDLGEGEDFSFTFRDPDGLGDWLPAVRDQLIYPSCWAMTCTQGVSAFFSYPDGPIAPVYSPQCLIDGLPSHCRVKDDYKPEVIKGRYSYSASTYLGLRYMERYGISFEENRPYVGYFQGDRAFPRDAEIVQPFRVPQSTSPEKNKRIMEKHGCLMGTYFCLKTTRNNPPQRIYDLPPSTLRRKLVSHCALVVGVGREIGLPFLEIENSHGMQWGDEGFGLVSLNLFHILHGLKQNNDVLA